MSTALLLHDFARLSAIPEVEASRQVKVKGGFFGHGTLENISVSGLSADIGPHSGSFDTAPTEIGSHS